MITTLPSKYDKTLLRVYFTACATYLVHYVYHVVSNPAGPAGLAISGWHGWHGWQAGHDVRHPAPHPCVGLVLQMLSQDVRIRGCGGGACARRQYHLRN